VTDRKTNEENIAEMIHSIGLFVRRVRAAAAEHELSLTESSVLARLARDGPSTTADLARAESVRPQSMGTTISGLEERGLVERRPHPTDGRQVHIALTPAGLELREKARDAKHSWLAQQIAGLDKQDQETLFAVGKIIQRMVKP